MKYSVQRKDAHAKKMISVSILEIRTAQSNILKDSNVRAQPHMKYRNSMDCSIQTK